MTSFCQCETCKKMRKKHKYPLCKHCNEHHDARLICPEMKHLFDNEEKPICPYCNGRHHKKLRCREYIEAKFQNSFEKENKKWKKLAATTEEVIITAIQQIDPKDCVYYIELENGKYTVYIQHHPYEFKALRHGEAWRDLCGDNLIFHLMVDLIEAKKKLMKAMKLLEIVGANCTGETKEAIQHLRKD